MPNRRRTWPYSRWDPELNRDPPIANYRAPGVWERSDRSVAGPLRMGTTPGVGPRGPAVEAPYSNRTDFGTDRISPRDFDPMGTCRNRFGDIPSDLIAEQVRGRQRRR